MLLLGVTDNNTFGLTQLYNDYVTRVTADGGSIDETQANLVSLLNQLNGAVPNFTNTCKLFVAPHLGNKVAAGTGATAGNRAANKIYNIFGASGDLVQATAASQPLLLRNTGVNYAYLPGVLGNFFSTPNAAANQITGDIEIIVNLTMPSFSSTTGVEKVLLSKADYAGNQRSYYFGYFASNSRLIFRISTNGGGFTSFTATADSTLANNSNGWLKVTYKQNNGSGNYEVKFWQSTNGVNYTQIGSTITSTSIANTFNSNAPLLIGSTGSLITNTGALEAIINYASISNSIDGTPTQIFNPASYNRSTSQTTWTSTTGEVWTLNTAATNNGLKAAIVDKTMIMGNGTSYGMQAPSFNLTGSAFTRYTVFRKFVSTLGSQIINELGSGVASNQGLYLAINSVADNEEFGINAGGLNNSRYTSNSVLMKVATSVANINNADEATPYLIDNSAQVLVAKDAAFNNTSPMNATGYNLLSRNNASSLWANASVFADLVFEGEHDATTRTNVFNILKTYFNLP